MSYHLLILSDAELRTQRWRPSVDIYRIASGWLLKFDLAGVRAEDVAVELRAGQVRVSGVRRDMTAQADCEHCHIEIAYCPFEREIQLPETLNNPRFSMEMRDGMLLVRIQENNA